MSTSLEIELPAKVATAELRIGDQVLDAADRAAVDGPVGDQHRRAAEGRRT